MNRALLALALLLALPRAHAASCSIGATDLAFGPYRYNGPAVDATATVSIHSCVDDGDASVSYEISIGTGASNDYADRTMAGPGAQLRYNVYADPGHMMVWGDGSGGTTTVTGGFVVAPGSTSASHTVFGRIPGQQDNLVPGTYSDSLAVTIDY